MKSPPKIKHAVRLATLTFIGMIAFGIFSHVVSPGPLPKSKDVMIDWGSSLGQIADTLSREEVIAHPLLFKLVVRGLKKGDEIKAGEKRFFAFASPWEVIEILTSNRTVMHRITIAEGLTTQQALKVVAENPILVGEIMLNPREGELLPETYNFARGYTRDKLIEQMKVARRKTLERLWENRADDLPYDTPEEALVMASIIERETSLKSEMRKVAGVFANRLRKGMRLQSDPTVIYAISHGSGDLGRALTRADLKVESPYNTYVVKGLPPGPICNPGKEAIKAALDPDDTDALYFVADGTGGHAFADDLKEHNANVEKWRKYLRDRK